MQQEQFTSPGHCSISDEENFKNAGKGKHLARAVEEAGQGYLHNDLR